MTAKAVTFSAHLAPMLAKAQGATTPEQHAAALASIQSFLNEVGKAQAAPFTPEFDVLAKSSTFAQSGSATSGLTYYDLELGAKFLYPVLTPLRNEIPRVSGKGGIQANWRAVTAINTSGLRLGVSAGNRGGVIAVATQDYNAAYKGIGLETTVDYEAQYAGMGFDDIRAIGAKVGLESTMIGEEASIVGANSSVALGTTPTPTLADVGTGGSLAFNTTYSVICIALSHDAMINGSVVGGVQGQITRTNADGSTDTFGGGASRKSNNATVTTANDSANTHKITATVAAVTGALGYAWFWGLAGAEVLGAITPNTANSTAQSALGFQSTANNSIIITGNATGTQTAASLGTGDNSTNNLIFDGLITQTVKSGNNGYVRYLATGTAGVGSTLTGDGAGGIVEIDDFLQDRWDNYRLGPDTAWMGSQVARNLSTKILAGQANAAQRFVFESEQSALGGGVMVRTYLNKFSMSGASTIDFRIHPNMPPGAILFTTKKIPYPLANIGNVMQIKTRQDYYQVEWPRRSRKYETGVYADEVLQHYFPPSMGFIGNIAAG